MSIVFLDKTDRNTKRSVLAFPAMQPNADEETYQNIALNAKQGSIRP